jgi:hypothetical protein
MPRKKGPRFKEATVVSQNGKIFVDFADRQTTPFITTNCPTSSKFLKFSKSRKVETWSPARPNLNLIEIDLENAREKLKTLFALYKINEKPKKRKVERNYEISKRIWPQLVDKIKKLLEERFKIPYISSLLGVNERKIRQIQNMIQQKLYFRINKKKGRCSKITVNQLTFLKDMFANKKKGFGYLPSRVILETWLKRCELPSNFIKPRYFREILHKKLGYSYKKNSTFKQKGNTFKNKEYRQKFVQWNLKLLEMNKEFIFIDECGFNLEDHKTYGWNAIGKPLPTRQSIKSMNYTLIGAMTKEGLLGYLILQGGSISQIFVGFFCYLINHLAQINNQKMLHDYVFVIDNAKSHLRYFSEYIRPGINLLWTPPYTPQLNPIEIIWGLWKKMVYSSESWRTQEDLIFAITNKSRSLKSYMFLQAYKHTLRFYDLCLCKEDIF